MKKIILSLAVIAAISFTACSDDDDPQRTCQTCDLDFFGAVISSQYCDNGDGTMTVTIEGQEEVVSLEGQSFSEFIAAFEEVGTCN